MKQPQDMHDLFASCEVAQPELAERARVFRSRTSRPIHISGYDRKVQDFYATPDWVTEALLRHVQFRGRVWEPCCGTGAITTVLQRHGYSVTSTDIADHGFGAPGVDFFSSQAVPEGCRALVTNPPYGRNTPSRKGREKSAMAMLRFVDHALRLTESVQWQLALLVRFQWVAGHRAAALTPKGGPPALPGWQQKFDVYGGHPPEKLATVSQPAHGGEFLVDEHAHRGSPIQAGSGRRRLGSLHAQKSGLSACGTSASLS